MKNLIVLIALLIYMATVITFQIDLNKNIKYKWLLKDIADDCTAGAALQIDNKFYSEGMIIFDYKEAIIITNELLNYNVRESECSFLITFMDDSGYATTFDDKKNKISELKYSVENPIIEIVLTGNSPEFRLEIIDPIDRITVRSTYEYLGY